MSASLRVPGQGYFSRGNKKGGSHKQEHAGAHTWPTNDKGGSDRNQTWSVTHTDEGTWECGNAYFSEII